MQHLKVRRIHKPRIRLMETPMLVFSVAIFRRMWGRLSIGSMAIRAGCNFDGGGVRRIAEGELFGVLVEHDHGGTVATYR